MKNCIMTFDMIILLNILLIKLSSTSLIFPFKIIKEEKNEKISSDDISYNYKNFLDEYFNQIVYTNISLGNQLNQYLTNKDYTTDNTAKVTGYYDCWGQWKADENASLRCALDSGIKTVALFVV